MTGSHRRGTVRSCKDTALRNKAVRKTSYTTLSVSVTFLCYHVMQVLANVSAHALGYTQEREKKGRG